MGRTPSSSATQCDICKKTIGRPADLKRHMNTHNSNKDKLRCTQPGCSYTTWQLSNLKTHQKLHSGKKDKICPDCDYRASDPACLTRHRKRQHDYVPAPRRRADQTKRATPRSVSPVTESSPSPVPMTPQTEDSMPSPRRFVRSPSMDEPVSAPVAKSLQTATDVFPPAPYYSYWDAQLTPAYDPLLEALSTEYQSYSQPDLLPSFSESYYPVNICAPMGEYQQQFVASDSPFSYEDMLHDSSLQYLLQFQTQGLSEAVAPETQPIPSFYDAQSYQQPSAPILSFSDTQSYQSALVPSFCDAQNISYQQPSAPISSFCDTQSLTQQPWADWNFYTY